MIVYAKSEIYIWSSVRMNHKQGKVPAGTPLSVLKASDKWYELEPSTEGQLDRSVKAGYPAFWVRVEDTYEAAGPSPPPNGDLSAVSDEQVAEAILVILKWFKA